MERVAQLARQLADLDELLRSLPDDAFAEKHAVDADRQRSDADLLAELSGLRSALTTLEAQKIDLVTQAGGGATGMGNMGNLGGVEINAGMMEASGASRIQGRIGVIKGILADRGVEVPEPT